MQSKSKRRTHHEEAAEMTSKNQEEEPSSLTAQLWDDLKMFWTTVLLGTIAGTAIASVYVVLAVYAFNAQVMSDFYVWVSTAAVIFIGLPTTLFLLLRMPVRRRE